MRKRLTGLVAAATLALAGTLAAAERGTQAEAKAMLAKAVAHYQEVGRRRAFADFTARKPPFFDRDLYVVCLGPDDTIVAHGGFPRFVGSSADALRDAEGRPLGKALWQAASGGGDGSVRYRWLNPVSGRAEPKVSFVRKVGNDACIVGAYGGQ